MNEIHYPPSYAPAASPVYVRNEIISTASPEAVWKQLIDAKSWPLWYKNSANLKFHSPEPTLQLHTKFTWKTFGFTVDTEVVEFVPYERIAWRATAFGINAYHAWLILPTAGGCRIVTEETQRGFICVAGKYLMPNKMFRWHQRWLDELSIRANRLG